MKLLRFGDTGNEKPGVQIGEERYDVSSFGKDYDEHFFADNGISQLQSFIKANQGSLTLLPDNVRLGPPVHRPGKLICIGLNYRDHAIETGAPIPQEPIIFFKATSAL